jgi:ABC-type dipeptide/oligopeptide/nickel transport system permease subunit
VIDISTVKHTLIDIKKFIETFIRRKKGFIGFIIIMFFILTAILAEYIAPYDPYKITGIPYSPPDSNHILGTNDLGQDIFSETIYGARISLFIGFIAGLSSTILATIIGIIAGYYEGIVSRILTGLMDMFLVVPGIPLIILLAVYLGPGIWNIITVITILSWAPAARVIKGHALSIKNRPFIEAIKALGASNMRILAKHILPNVLPIIFANSILRIVDAILLEAAISFLGLGDPRTKSWGAMLYFAQQRGAFSTGAWWWILPPGICISITAIGFSLIAFTLDEIFNPRLESISWR